jgi:hypothetical protein
MTTKEFQTHHDEPASPSDLTLSGWYSPSLCWARSVVCLRYAGKLGAVRHSLDGVGVATREGVLPDSGAPGPRRYRSQYFFLNGLSAATSGALRSTEANVWKSAFCGGFVGGRRSVKIVEGGLSTNSP